MVERKYAMPGDRTCPSCGGTLTGLTIELDGVLHTGCGHCKLAWEVAPEAWRTKSPLQCGPCDSCAYRPKSAEMSEIGSMFSLQACVEAPRAFHCHKGVPYSPGAGQQPFQFAMKDDVEPEPGYRVCGGWARARQLYVKGGDPIAELLDGKLPDGRSKK